MYPQNGLMSGEDTIQMTSEVLQLYAQRGRLKIYCHNLFQTFAQCEHYYRALAPDGLSLSFLSLNLSSPDHLQVSSLTEPLSSDPSLVFYLLVFFELTLNFLPFLV